MSNRNRRRKNNNNKQAKPVVQILSEDAARNLSEKTGHGNRAEHEPHATENAPEPDAEQMLLLQEDEAEAEMPAAEEKAAEEKAAEEEPAEEPAPPEDSEEEPETAAKPEYDLPNGDSDYGDELQPKEYQKEEEETKSVEISGFDDDTGVTPEQETEQETEQEKEPEPKSEPEEQGEASAEEQSDVSGHDEEEKEDGAVGETEIPEVPDLKIENVPQFYIDDEEEEEEKEEQKEEEKGSAEEDDRVRSGDEQEEEVRRPRRKPRQEIEVRPEPRRRERKRTGAPPRREPDKIKPKATEKPQKLQKTPKVPKARQAKRERGKIGNKRFNILFVTEGTGRVRTIRTTTDTVILVNVIAAALFIAVIAYIIHANIVREEHIKRLEAQEETMTTLSEDAIILQAEIERLENELKAAQDKISVKENRAQAKTEAEALQYIPSALPVDSQALPSEYDRKNKWITIDAAPGVHVVAAGDGTVEYAGESVEAGGYLVTVDHGNGYKSNYYCQSKPVVKKGERVSRGTALIAIGENADKLIYRIIYEDDFIDPYTVLNISG